MNEAVLKDGDTVTLTCDLYCNQKLCKGDHGIVRLRHREWGVEVGGHIYYKAVKGKSESVRVIDHVEARTE